MRELRIVIAASALAAAAGPAVAEALREPPAGVWTLAEATPAARLGRAGVAYALSERLDLTLSLRTPKDKLQGELSGRRTEASPGRLQQPRALKLGVRVRW